jgi:hypothetical protein
LTVNKEIEEMLSIDPKNGHGLYFSGAFKRFKNPSLFKICASPTALAGYTGSLDPYEDDFYQYLDTVKTLADSAAGGDLSAETCYARPSGYCPQRTAWISHVLANDLYEQATLSNDPVMKAETMRRALVLAEATAKLYTDENHNPGFSQCTPTTILIDKIKSTLNLPTNSK